MGRSSPQWPWAPHRCSPGRRVGDPSVTPAWALPEAGPEFAEWKPGINPRRVRANTQRGFFPVALAPPPQPHVSCQVRSFSKVGGQLLLPLCVLSEPCCFYNDLLLKTTPIPAMLGLLFRDPIKKQVTLMMIYYHCSSCYNMVYIYQDSNYIFRCQIYSLNTVMDGRSWDRLLLTWAGHPVASQLGCYMNMRYLQINDCALSVQRGSGSTAQTPSILCPNSQRSRDVDSFRAASWFSKISFILNPSFLSQMFVLCS